MDTRGDLEFGLVASLHTFWSQNGRILGVIWSLAWLSFGLFLKPKSVDTRGDSGSVIEIGGRLGRG